MSKKKPRLSAEQLAALMREDGKLFHDAQGRAIEMPHATAPLADTHGHLTHFYKLDAAWAIARASLAGVALLGVPLDPTGDAADAEAVLCDLDRWEEQAARHVDEMLSWGVQPATDDPYALLGNIRILGGTHPYGAAQMNADRRAWEALDRLLASPRAAGVGEIGLDYGPYNKVDPAEQHRAFVDQLRVAHERGLPVELHIRDAERDPSAQAHADAARILEQEGVPEAGCDLHCYTSDARVMEPFVEMGCYVAFGGAATFARSEDIRDAAIACPADLLLSETDSPYMAPTPLRGMECEPAMVVFSAALVAEVREQAGVATTEDTYAALWRNGCSLLGRA